MSNRWFTQKLSIFLAIGSLSLSGTAIAQETISEIPFEIIPANTTLTSDSITLNGNAIINGAIVGAGPIESQEGGFRFPDGSVQTTAATTDTSGLYSNRIPDFLPPLPYSEVCFKQDMVLFDTHSISESTAGGNCLPGDTGWVIERDERSPALWQRARVECLLKGMRLPEFFEWHFSCENASSLSLNDVTGHWEWASNQVAPIADPDGGASGIGASAAGFTTCDEGIWGWAARNGGGIQTFAFRCVR